MDYVPRANSLAARLVEFFGKNPEERLSRQDIGLKFDVANTSGLEGNLAAAISHGLIAKTGPAEYGAGPELLASLGQPEPTSGFKAWLANKSLEAVKGRGAGAPLPDPAALVIESGVPIPEPLSELTLRFAARFAEMKVGDSFPCTHDVAKVLITSASKWGKGLGRRFVMRRTTSTEARIWRKD